MNYLIPESLNLEKMLKGIGYDEKYIAKNLDKYYTIISMIYHKRFMNPTLFKNKQTIAESLYKELKGSTMKKMVGYRYVDIRNDLERLNIIESDGWFKVGEKSKGYRLMKPYRHEKAKRIKATDNKIIERIEKVKNRIQINSNVHEWLFHKFDLIQFENESAAEYAERYYETERNRLDFEFENKMISEKKYDDSVYSLINSYESMRFDIEDFSKKNYFYHENIRAYSSMANINSELRQFIKVKNRNLVKFDISNSQFLFLSQIIFNDNLCYTSSIPSLYSSYSIKNSTNHQASLYDSDFSLKFDQLNFMNLTMSGGIYDYVQTWVNEFYDKNFDRDTVKRNMIRLMYADRSYQNDVYEPTFEFLFPNVWNYVQNENSKGKNYLHSRLTKAEADFVYNKVCRRVMNEKGEMPLYIIHDCFMCLPEDADYLLNVIKEEGGLFVPKLK